MDPERAHQAAGCALRIPLAWKALWPMSMARSERLTVNFSGLTFPTPIGVAAGLDKDCKFLSGLLDLGFGFATGGTVTLGPRPGNPKPRMLRLKQSGAIINALGFPGAGLEPARKRLSRLGSCRRRVMVSISGTIEDEVAECHRAIKALVAGVEVNISSPNTSGLRVFHEPGRLRGLVELIASEKSVPIFVKMPPWSREAESRREALRLAETAVDAGADGLVVANTHPVEDARLAIGRGGLSGAPLTESTLRMVAEAKAAVGGGGAAVIACGGISSAEHAWRLLSAGASALQLYTAFVYEGPGLPGRINRGLLKLMDRAGVRTVAEIAGEPFPG